MGQLYLALLHYPVLNKRGEIVATSITPFDLHDIARSSLTFGVKRYYVVNPYPAQHVFAQRFVDFWGSDAGASYNITRTEALENMVLAKSLAEVIADIPRPRYLVVTTAKRRKGAISFASLRRKLKGKGNFLLILGTGWGLADQVIAQADHVLEPIAGKGRYNHLSVRSAAAIILDRLTGGRS